jgi:hypothetical protein
MQNSTYKAFIISILAFAISSCGGPTFDVTVKATGKRGDGDEIKEGTVQLKFGKRAPLPEQALDAKGRAVFSIPESMRGDSVLVIYHSASNKHFRILEQRPYVVDEENLFQITVDFPTEFTSFQWSLRDKAGNGIEGALITINNRYKMETGSNGYFAADLPQYPGTKAHFKIEKDGKTLLDRDLTVVPEYQRLIIE